MYGAKHFHSTAWPSGQMGVWNLWKYQISWGGDDGGDGGGGATAAGVGEPADVDAKSRWGDSRWKTGTGWRETEKTEHGDGDQVFKSEVTFFIPSCTVYSYIIFKYTVDKKMCFYWVSEKYIMSIAFREFAYPNKESDVNYRQFPQNIPVDIFK